MPERPVVVVTGAAGVVGSSVCATLAAGGYVLVMVDKDGALRDQVDEEAKIQECAIALVGDVTAESTVEQIAEEASRRGTVTALVNCVASVGRTRLEDASPTEWRREFDVNVLSALLVGRALLPYLKESGTGSIINISSVAGVFPPRERGAYGPSKAALDHLTRQMALEWGSYGIRCNSIVLGLLTGRMVGTASLSDAEIARRSQLVPLGRLGEAEDVARLVHFLVTEGTYLNGASIPVTGGFELGLLNSVEPNAALT